MIEFSAKITPIPITEDGGTVREQFRFEFDGPWSFRAKPPIRRDRQGQINAMLRKGLTVNLNEDMTVTRQKKERIVVVGSLTRLSESSRSYQVCLISIYK